MAGVDSRVPDVVPVDERNGSGASGSNRPVAPRSGAQGAQPISSESVVPEDVTPELTSVTDTRSQTRRPRVRLDARAWNQVRLVLDLAVLYIAAAAALVVDGRFYTRGDLILAALYPLVALSVLRARGWANERLKTTFVDTISTVVAGVSLATMLVIAAASIFHVGRPLSLSVRLWLYASVYLSVARYMLLIIRRRAVSGEIYATPTLIIGAGVIGSHLARRLLSDRSYGLRPVGLLDPDPLSNADQFEAAPGTGARWHGPAFGRRSRHRCAPRDPRLLLRAGPPARAQGPGVSGPRRRGLADPADVRVDQRAHHARPRRGPAAADAAHGRSPRLAVRGQARARPHGRRDRAAARLPAAGGAHRADQALLPRTDPVPPAASRP